MGPEKVDRVRVAPRTVHEVQIRCGGLKQVRALRQRIEQTLHRQSIEPTDMVSIRVEGKADHGDLWKIYGDAVREMYFLTKMDTSRVRANIDFRKYAKGADTKLTTEGLFVLRIKELLDDASAPKREGSWRRRLNGD